MSNHAAKRGGIDAPPPPAYIDVSPGDIFAIGALRNLLKASCANAGGMRAWGRLHDISAPYISRVIAGKKIPGQKLLDALNLQPSTVYVFKNRSRRGR
jgi:hypothetical protein